MSRSLRGFGLLFILTLAWAWAPAPLRADSPPEIRAGAAMAAPGNPAGLSGLREARPDTMSRLWGAAGIGMDPADLRTPDREAPVGPQGVLPRLVRLLRSLWGAEGIGMDPAD